MQRRPLKRVPIARKRLAPKFCPSWHDSPYEGYAHAWVHKNYWRVVNRCPTRDDAVQECAVMFLHCVDYYIDHPEKAAKQGYQRVDNPKWFMSLYKSALYYRWIRLQWEDEDIRKIEETHRPVGTAGDDPAITHWTQVFSRIEHPEGVFALAYAESSVALRTVVNALLEAPQGVIDLLLGDARGDALFDRKHREMLNRRLRRWCGLPKGIDVIGELAELLKS